MEAYTGEMAALATACCWTATAMLFESASKRVGSLPVNLIRLAMALAFFCLHGWVVRGLPLPTDASAHAWLWLSISGLVGFTLGDLCLFQAWVLVGARLASLVQALVPLLVALFGFFWLGEKLSARQWLGMAITVSGVAWVALERLPQRSVPEATGRSRGKTLPGLLLALGGAFGQAGGLVISKYGLRDYSPFAGTQIRVIAGTVGLALVFVFARQWPKVIPALKDKPALLRTFFGALVGPFLGVALSLLAVQNTHAGVAATIMALTPVFIIPAVWIVRKERVSLRAVLGAVLAVAGVALLFA